MATTCQDLRRLKKISSANFWTPRLLGQILKSAYFETPNGSPFVAVVLGFYAGGDTLAFRELGFDTKALVPVPTEYVQLLRQSIAF